MENNSIVAVPIGDFYWFGCPLCCAQQCHAYEFKDFEVRRCENADCGKPIGLYHDGAVVPTEFSWSGIQPVQSINHPAKAGASDKLLHQARLATIRVSIRGQWFTIVTTRFYGETKRTIASRLKAEFESHRIAYADFHVEMSSGKELLQSLVIDSTDDSPGAAFVTMKCSLVVQHKYHLPRDAETHKFIDLPKQTQCLSILREQ